MDFGQVYKIGRNDICICGSGKKYKKCCLINPKISESYEITNEPLTDIYLDENFSDADRKIYEDISEKIVVHKCVDYRQALEILKKLNTIYPNVKRIHNLLGVCYQALNMKDELDKILLETYEKFPEYLFAKTSYVSYWMAQGDYSKFKEVFSDRYDLKSIYPHRTKFHVSEAVSFFGVCGRYFASQGNIIGARNFVNMLKKFDRATNEIRLIEVEIDYFSLKKLFATNKLLQKLGKTGTNTPSHV